MLTLYFDVGTKDSRDGIGFEDDHNLARSWAECPDGATLRLAGGDTIDRMVQGVSSHRLNLVKHFGIVVLV